MESTREKDLHRILQCIYIRGRCANRGAVDPAQHRRYDQNTDDEQRSTPLTLHFALAFLNPDYIPNIV